MCRHWSNILVSRSEVLVPPVKLETGHGDGHTKGWHSRTSRKELRTRGRPLVKSSELRSSAAFIMRIEEPRKVLRSGLDERSSQEGYSRREQITA